MELKLPYIDPADFAATLTNNYSFGNNGAWNSINLMFPENVGEGALQLYIRNDIHYFRGKWKFKEESMFISKDQVGKKGLIDFRVNKSGQIHSASIEGDKRFEWEITEVDGFRFFIPEKYLNLHNGRFPDHFEKYCYNNNIINLQKQILTLSPDDIPSAMLLESKMLEFIYYWIDYLRTEEIDLHFDDISNRHLSAVNNAHEIVQNHINKTLSIKLLSRKVGLNEYDLKKNFKKIYGLPIHQYHIKLRLEQARELIRTTDLPIATISQIIGYSNRGHFSSLYQRFFGTSPLQDRLTSAH